MAAKRKHSWDKTAVHFVLKWGFEVNPVSNNSRMLGTKDFRDIASASDHEAGPVLKKWTSTFSLWSFRKLWHHVEGLNCGYFGTKSKVIGQVEEELWFFLPFFKIDGWHFFMNLASLMWNIWKNNQNEGLQKIGPIICTVENEISKC